MKTLVVGAGATGGYFGGRLLQAGCDITFLVRPQRAQLLASKGLRIHSPHGDAHILNPPTVLPARINATYDAILLSCKAYDLLGAVEAFAPAVGAQTLVIPLLNGMKHLDLLDQRFGRETVLGGLCTIHVTVNEAGSVVQLHRMQSLAFGDRSQMCSDRVRPVADLLEYGQFNSRSSNTILHDMWEKWVLIAALAASTCLMRSSTASILAVPGGPQLIRMLIDECSSVASANGFSPRHSFREQHLTMLTEAESELTSSMLRDIQAGLRVEADNIIGDLVARAEKSRVPVPMLRIAYAHLAVYQLGAGRRGDLR
jgi:2-dehydropantoate 2-reductase